MGRGICLSALLLPSGALVSLGAQWEPCLDPTAPVCSVPPTVQGEGPEAGAGVHSLAARGGSAAWPSPDLGHQGPVTGCPEGRSSQPVLLTQRPAHLSQPTCHSWLTLQLQASSLLSLSPLLRSGLLCLLCPWECWGSGQPQGGVRLARSWEDPAGRGGCPAGPCRAHRPILAGRGTRSGRS